MRYNFPKNTGPIDTEIVGVTYVYLDRRNGWYAYAHNASGDQIGNAEYAYQKDMVLKAAAFLSRTNGNVPIKRG